jgi:hypothetical protein
MSRFESKFNLGDLVKFDQQLISKEKSYGYIRSVSFLKTDHVDLSISYKIELVNTADLVEVGEDAIERTYHAI